MNVWSWIAAPLRWFVAAISGIQTSQFPRNQIVDALDDIIRNSENGHYQAGVLVAQIDNFDRLEESYDGDILAKVMEIMQARLIDGPCKRDIFRRLGEGKFAVIPTPNNAVNIDQLDALSHSLLSLVAQPIQVGAHLAYLTASIGYAVQGQLPKPTGSGLLDAASSALRTATRQGPAAICSFNLALHELHSTREAQMNALKNALASGDIHPHFQPQVSMNSRKIIGVEALARWKHPDRGTISPAEFLPLVEELGMMPELGLAILAQALTALRDWNSEGLDIPAVAVNFSSEELRNPNLPEFVMYELEKNGLVPENLIIEVLETVVADGKSGRILANLNALSELGCRLDLDDFGTGNASITAIRTFGVDRIKIDRSFITDSNTDQDKQTMIEVMIAISEKLAVETLAEGVETEDELAFLAGVNCGSVQGFAIARPMARHDVATWLENWVKGTGPQFTRSNLPQAV